MRRATKDRLYGWSAILARSLGLSLPRSIHLKLGALLGAWAFRLAHKERERAYTNLGSSFSDKSPKELEQITRLCFQNLGKNLMEVLQFPRLTCEKVNELVSYTGREHLNAALDQGRGIVVVTAHLGNWELMGASLALNRYPLTVIARRLRSACLNQLLCEHRQQVGMRILFRGDSMISGLRLLKRNGILAILADVDTQTPGVFVDFFGRLAYTPYGPVAIALKTQAALLPMFVVRLPDDRHRVFIQKPLDLTSTGNWESDLRLNTQRFTHLIESYIRAHPEQWIWMHARWKTQDHEPRS